MVRNDLEGSVDLEGEPITLIFELNPKTKFQKFNHENTILKIDSKIEIFG